MSPNKTISPSLRHSETGYENMWKLSGKQRWQKLIPIWAKTCWFSLSVIRIFSQQPLASPVQAFTIAIETVTGYSHKKKDDFWEVFAPCYVMTFAKECLWTTPSNTKPLPTTMGDEHCGLPVTQRFSQLFFDTLEPSPSCSQSPQVEKSR